MERFYYAHAPVLQKASLWRQSVKEDGQQAQIMQNEQTNKQTSKQLLQVTGLTYQGPECRILGWQVQVFSEGDASYFQASGIPMILGAMAQDDLRGTDFFLI